MSLYIKHRPQTFEQVIGQKHAVSVLRGKLADHTLPSTIMLLGPTGSGKTTLARILARELGCEAPEEINCADSRGIEMVRDVVGNLGYAPLGGKASVWILDEIVQLPKMSQQAFLKDMEDVPSPSSYLVFLSSDATGLLPAFLGRCFVVELKPLMDEDIKKLICTVEVAEELEQREKFRLTANVRNAIVANSCGNARLALQLLEKVIALESEDDRLEAVGTLEGTQKGEFLARVLMNRGRWEEAVRSLQQVEEKDVEGLRRQVLAYMAKVVCGSKNSPSITAIQVIRQFREPFFHSGRAGLLLACWEVLNK